jgi:hypothetical protein
LDEKILAITFASVEMLIMRSIDNKTVIKSAFEKNREMIIRTPINIEAILLFKNCRVFSVKM